MHHDLFTELQSSTNSSSTNLIQVPVTALQDYLMALRMVLFCPGPRTVYFPHSSRGDPFKTQMRTDPSSASSSHVTYSKSRAIVCDLLFHLLSSTLLLSLDSSHTVTFCSSKLHVVLSHCGLHADLSNSKFCPRIHMALLLTSKPLLSSHLLNKLI